MDTPLNDAELAARLAMTAGDILNAIRASGLCSAHILGNAGDQTANQFLIHAIRQQRPDDGLLSEESKDTPDRLRKSRVWIIDPVDGTREYGEGRTDWAVHVALAVDGRPVIGAVALPGLGILLRSDQTMAAPVRPARPRMLVSRTRPGAEAIAIAKALGAELIPMGSAGAKAMAVVRGEADIYLHSGGQHEWDSAAPVAVALAHGLHCSRIDGSPLIYNQTDTYLPDLLICEKDKAKAILALVRELATT